MIHPDTEVRWINEHVGKGVFATRLIPRGTIVWTQCDFDIVMSSEKLTVMPKPYRDIASVYGYVSQTGETILCWDEGRFVNHSCDPSMLSLGHKVEIAVRDIEPGDELTCDYGTLNYSSALHCLCASPLCRGKILAEDALDFDAIRQEKLINGVRAAATVAQPLLQFVQDLAEWNAYVNGTLQPPSADVYYFKKQTI